MRASGSTILARRAALCRSRRLLCSRLSPLAASDLSHTSAGQTWFRIFHYETRSFGPLSFFPSADVTPVPLLARRLRIHGAPFRAPCSSAAPSSPPDISPEPVL